MTGVDPEIRLSVLLGELDRVAAVYDGDHVSRHGLCPHGLSLYQDFVGHVTRELRAVFESTDEQVALVLPDNLSKDQRHRLRKKYGLTRKYTRRT